MKRHHHIQKIDGFVAKALHCYWMDVGDEETRDEACWASLMCQFHSPSYSSRGSSGLETEPAVLRFLASEVQISSELP